MHNLPGFNGQNREKNEAKGRLSKITRPNANIFA
jgi:hypothetical protein